MRATRSSSSPASTRSRLHSRTSNPRATMPWSVSAPFAARVDARVAASSTAASPRAASPDAAARISRARADMANRVHSRKVASTSRSGAVSSSPGSGFGPGPRCASTESRAAESRFPRGSRAERRAAANCERRATIRGRDAFASRTLPSRSSPSTGARSAGRRSREWMVRRRSRTRPRARQSDSAASPQARSRPAAAERRSRWRHQKSASNPARASAAERRSHASSEAPRTSGSRRVRASKRGSSASTRALPSARRPTSSDADSRVRASLRAASNCSAAVSNRASRCASRTCRVGASPALRGREGGCTGNLRRKRSPHLPEDVQRLPRAVEVGRLREAGPADHFGESSRGEGQGLRLAEHPPIAAGKGAGGPLRALPESLARLPKRLELRAEIDDPRPFALKGVDPRGEASPLGRQRPFGRETGVRFRGSAGDELQRAGAQRGNAGVGGGGGRGGATRSRRSRRSKRSRRGRRWARRRESTLRRGSSPGSRPPVRRFAARRRARIGGRPRSRVRGERTRRGRKRQRRKGRRASR